MSLFSLKKSLDDDHKILPQKICLKKINDTP